MEAPSAPSHRQVAALAGEWYRQRVGAYGDQDIQDLHWEIAIELFGDDPAIVAGSDPEQTAPVPEALNSQRAVGFLKRHGFSTDPDSVNRLAASLARAESAFLKLVKRRTEGDWSPDPNLPQFPELQRDLPSAATTPSRCSLDDFSSAGRVTVGLTLPPSQLPVLPMIASEPWPASGNSLVTKMQRTSHGPTPSDGKSPCRIGHWRPLRLGTTCQR